MTRPATAQEMAERLERKAPREDKYMTFGGGLSWSEARTIAALLRRYAVLEAAAKEAAEALESEATGGCAYEVRSGEDCAFLGYDSAMRCGTCNSKAALASLRTAGKTEK